MRADRAFLAPHLKDAIDVGARFADGAPPREWLAVGAVALHGWYTGLETLLERVARALGARRCDRRAAHPRGPPSSALP